jgi:P pilus assembly chaperone PapD
MQEKTYRIFVEEMPSPDKETQGATIRMFMKIGIPVFINPPRIEDRPDIRNITMRDGKVAIDVSNGGNSHFMVTGINVQGEDSQGKDRFNRDIGGWYLLSGSSKVYETSIPQETCGTITSLTVELKTNKTTIKRKMPVEKAMCGYWEVIANAK